MQVTNITADGQPFGERETLPIGLTKPGTEGITYSEQSVAHWTYCGTDLMSNPPSNPPPNPPSDPPLHATCGDYEMATDIDAQDFPSPCLQLPPENASYPNHYAPTN